MLYVDDRRYRRRPGAIRRLYGRLLFWLIAPAFEHYNRRYRSLVVRPDGSYVYPAAGEKQAERLFGAFPRDREG